MCVLCALVRVFCFCLEIIKDHSIARYGSGADKFQKDRLLVQIKNQITSRNGRARFITWPALLIMPQIFQCTLLMVVNGEIRQTYSIPNASVTCFAQNKSFVH